jgi:thioredoxin-related protein
MRSIIIAAFIAAGSFAGITANAQNSIKKVEGLLIGAKLPVANEKMRSTDGKDVTLKSATTANGLIVMFSCNTCPYVVKSQERIKETMAYAKEKGIGMVIVNSNDAYRGKDDSYDAMKKYAKAQGYSVPYVVDEKSKVADAFGATRTPEVFLFDKTGTLVYKGAMEDNPTAPAESKSLYLKDAVSKMLTGHAPDPAETKSIGCSIKRSI